MWRSSGINSWTTFVLFFHLVRSHHQKIQNKWSLLCWQWQKNCLNCLLKLKYQNKNIIIHYKWKSCTQCHTSEKETKHYQPNVLILGKVKVLALQKNVLKLLILLHQWKGAFFCGCRKSKCSWRNQHLQLLSKCSELKNNIFM